MLHTALTYLASLVFQQNSVQLYSPRYHCSQLCCHPRRVPVVVKPESISCGFMLEIRVPQVHLLWPTIPPLQRIRKEMLAKDSLWLAAATAVAAGPTPPPREQEARVLRPRLVISRKQHDSRSSVWRTLIPLRIEDAATTAALKELQNRSCTKFKSLSI